MPEPSERQRLLDQIMDPRNRQMLLAIYSRLNTQRPHHYDIMISRGVIHSLPTIADDYVRFTVRFYSRHTRRSRRREARCPAVLFAESCPTASQGDLIEFVSVIDGSIRDIIYIRRMADENDSPLERLVWIIGSMLALQPSNESEWVDYEND